MEDEQDREKLVAAMTMVMVVVLHGDDDNDDDDDDDDDGTHCRTHTMVRRCFYWEWERIWERMRVFC